MLNEQNSDISKDNPTSPICTSTPVKNRNCLLKYEDCINLSQCKACRIIQEIEERHENIFEDDYKMHEGRQDMKTDMRVS